MDDFIPAYPEISSHRFSYKIARKKEFYDLKLGSEEPVPKKPGTPLSSQELAKRYFSPYTNYTTGLILHGFGTGKTCLYSFIAENFKNSGNLRKRVLVLVKNEDLVRNHEKEIAERCTQDIYRGEIREPQIMRKEYIEKARFRALRREISQTYEIRTWGVFLKNLPKDREQVRSVYSNRIIIIDEAHNLSPSKETEDLEDQKKGFELLTRKELEKLTRKDLIRLYVLIKKTLLPPKCVPKEQCINALEGKATRNDLLALRGSYKRMHEFLHTVEDCRILLLTGSPIWDRTYEIADLVNLVLPENEQLDTGIEFDKKYFDDEGNLKNSEDLKRVLRGKVSFLRSMMTTARREEIGFVRPWLKYTKVYPDGMSPYQYTNMLKKFSPSGESKEGGAFLKEAREAANMVLPTSFDEKGKPKGASSDRKTFESYVTVTATGRYTLHGREVKNTKKQKRQKLLVQELQNNLKKYSTKFASIIKQIREHPKELTFIYVDDFVMGAGGGMMIALILDIMRKEGRNEFKWAHRTSEISRPSPVKRFAIFSSLEGTINTPREISRFWESFSRKDNMYGQRCQIIIGSRKIGEGLTLKNVRQVHILMPHWNIPRINQALGRVFRVGSHNDLPEEERYLRIFRHVAVKGSIVSPDPQRAPLFHKGEGFPEQYGFYQEKTVDTYIYRIAEEKEHRNTQIYRLLKEISWDCSLTYKRNVLPSDVDGSVECDYQKCNYSCDGFPPTKKGKVWSYNIPPEKIQRDTYNLLYASGKVREITQQLKDLFQVYFALSLEDIVSLLNLDEKDSSLLLAALDSIIDSKSLLQNRYGFSSYLKEQNNIYFLDNSIGLGKYPDSFYARFPLITDRLPLRKIVSSLELKEELGILDSFCRSPDIDLFSYLRPRTQVILLEYIYHLSRSSNLRESEKAVVKEMKDLISRDFFQMKDGKTVHFLFDRKHVPKITGQKRVYDPKTGVWSTIENRKLEKAYNKQISQQIEKRKKDIWKDNPYDLLGFTLPKEPEVLKILKNHPRHTGIKCTTIVPTSKILRFAFRLGTFPKPDPEYQNEEKYPRDRLISLIKADPAYKEYKNYKEVIKNRSFQNKSLNKLSTDQLRSLLTLFAISKSGKFELCNVLRKRFEELGLFYKDIPIQ